MTAACTLRDLVAQPDYAGTVLSVVSRVAGAANPPEALELLQAAMAAMVVEQAVFVSYLRDEDSHESYRFMLAADPRWCFEYQARAWYASDPWLQYAAMNSEPTCASRIVARTAQQREVQQLAQRHGMVSVCIAPAASAGLNARVGMLALGSAQSGYFEGEGFAVFKVLARGLAAELHAWRNEYERGELLSTLRVTDDEIRLLQLGLDGVGTKKAAGLLGTTTASIDSRWYRLNQKLGSPQRRATARLAAKLGLI